MMEGSGPKTSHSNNTKRIATPTPIMTINGKLLCPLFEFCNFLPPLLLGMNDD